MRLDLLGVWAVLLGFCVAVWVVVSMVAIAVWAWLLRPWGELVGAWPW